jgi:hypothetical protein
VPPCPQLEKCPLLSIVTGSIPKKEDKIESLKIHINIPKNNNFPSKMLV